MKKLVYVGGGSLLLLIALLCGALFASPILASAHSTDTKPTTTTTTTTKDKHPERRPLRVFVRNRSDEFVDRIARRLNLTPAELTARLKSGERLVDIAKDKGVSKASLRTILINAADASIAQALQNGKINQQQADALKKLVQDHPFVVGHVLHHHFYHKK